MGRVEIGWLGVVTDWLMTATGLVMMIAYFDFGGTGSIESRDIPTKFANLVSLFISNSLLIATDILLSIKYL